MTKRDPHVVLGVEPGADLARIRAAWRRLARENHPDLLGDDPEVAIAATRRMAEINQAYQALRDEAAQARRRSRPGGPGGPAGAPAGRRAPWPPPEPPTRPVTARLDTSDLVRPRNATVTRGGPAHPPGLQPRKIRVRDSEPPRASQPTGAPEHGRVVRHRPPRRPSVEEARAIVIDFGKFRGHTLGEIEGFEPSYVDWVARTITRDFGLVTAARVIAADMDRRGVARGRREPDPVPGRRLA
jgi:hypothetical protein